MLKRAILIALVLLVCSGSMWFLTLPRVKRFQTENPAWTAVMDQRAVEAAWRKQALQVRQTWKPLSSVPYHLRQAIIVAEDGKFRKHNGIDWNALADECHYERDGDWAWTDGGDVWNAMNAVLYCFRHSGSVRGRSTITQQVAKNLFYGNDRSVTRKFREFFVARRLEGLGKDRILELYINIAEFAPGVFGVEEGARHYFGCSASELSRAQAMELAATLRGPLVSNPRTRTSKFRQNLRRIQRSM